ncbi:beta-N-acetylhexosaminidase [Aquimonas voraii]|uniref:beta-N-acetylhexosaminidase n=1 Tax=Aquimonas voraii TaxID=265719 RepID=A0A1G6UJA8_9GAMM|nr:beta-N-acetylhexosaminidase [Aquimonas voraii]
MLFIGIEGHQLRADEARWIAHPAVAGVVLFRRNYAEPAQLRALNAQIRAAGEAPRLVAVDQEGGRVQRFIEGFTRLPALARIGDCFADEPARCLELAKQHARLMVAELRAHDIDLSFAPVVDLGRGNRAIGDRAFAADVDAVCALTRAYVQAMQAAGMPSTLKHFPGHGSVLEDTHVDAALDPRPLDQLMREDLRPFAAGIEAGAAAVMAAHVRYPAVCEQPAGYSRHWLGEILRDALGFRGVVFSDDIGMAAAHAAGGVAARVNAHLDAGCDVVLACHPELVEDAIAAVEARSGSLRNPRLALLSPVPGRDSAPEALAQARANLAALV